MTTTFINGGMASPLRLTRGLSSVAIISPGCGHGADEEVNQACPDDNAAFSASVDSMASNCANTTDAVVHAADAADSPAFTATIDSESC